MENTGQDMGRQQRRVFQHESRADQCTTILVTDMWQARCAMDIADARGAWMIQRLSS